MSLWPRTDRAALRRPGHKTRLPANPPLAGDRRGTVPRVPDRKVEGPGGRPRQAGGRPRCAVSLKLTSVGPPGPPVAIREIDATPRDNRHDSSEAPPSAQMTAALIGDTWLTITRSSLAASGASSSHALATLAE